jgi:hypothetical protein
MPSLSTFRGSKDNLNTTRTTGNTNGNPANDDTTEMVPLQTLQVMEVFESLKTPEAVNSPNVSASKDHDEVLPREITRKVPISRPRAKENGAHKE